MIQTDTYQIGGSLPPDAPSYVIRQADSDLYNHLKSRDYSYVFNSRQMGKSSLRVRTMARLQRAGIACAVIDPQTIGTQIREDQWYAGVIKSLVQGFQLEATFDFRQWWRSLNEPPIPPVQRFAIFIEDILLTTISSPIVIFVEEIDSFLSLPFSADDVFILIRAFHEKRTQNAEFKRLTFALVGVTTPTDLIQDHNHSAFNIGTAIEMEGFTLAEAQPLAKGLGELLANPQPVLQAVLHWSGGQPFLTQKLLAIATHEIVSNNQPGEDIENWVANVVKNKVINNWEAQDIPQHLGTLQERVLLIDEKGRGRLLGLYQQILLSGGLTADNSYEQMQLRLTGLVVKEKGQLQVYNPIYSAVFNAQWTDRYLGELRPPFYTEALRAWHKSGDNDVAFLLRGQALKEVESWANGKRLSVEDERFLQASRQQEHIEQEKALAAEQERSELLAIANKKAKHRIRVGSLILAMAVLISGGTSLWRKQQIATLNLIIEENHLTVAKLTREIEVLYLKTEQGTLEEQRIRTQAEEQSQEVAEVSNQPTNTSTAVNAEKKGFEALVKGDLRKAKTSFLEAYEAFPLYHNVAEIKALIEKYDDDFNSAEAAEKGIILGKIYQTILDNYAWGAPSEVLIQMQTRLETKVEYFPRATDSKANVSEILSQLGFSTWLVPSQSSVPLNALWFSDQVDLQTVQLVSTILLEQGVDLQSIQPFPNESRNRTDNKIQIGGNLDSTDCLIWTAESIASAQSFTRANFGCR